MDQSPQSHPEKSKLHPRNPHRDRYDFQILIDACPDLSPFVRLSPYKSYTIDFADPVAVKLLNKALLSHYYGIAHWDIPEGYLCPPIPGRADYIHYIADLVAAYNKGKIPRGKSFRCLDIGVGANCVYPIIGNKAYHWSFVGTDTDPWAIRSARKIMDENPTLGTSLVCRLQTNPKDVFHGVILDNEYFDVSICNPPFHDSKEAAQNSALRKVKHLKYSKTEENPVLNFGGQESELWCEGGELGFVRNMITQSKDVGNSVFWFSTLISKQSNLKNVYDALGKAGAMDVETIPMGQGNKVSRIVAWTYLDKAKQKIWSEMRWSVKNGARI